MKMIPAICCLLVILAGDAACGKKAVVPQQARVEAPIYGAASDVHAGAVLPAACDEYRRQLLRCMENDHFPKSAKEAQRSALEQMLSLAKEESRRTDDPGAAKAVAENCRDSLSTLAESSKESCPGVF